MNYPHLHLMLNHIPALGTGFATLLLMYAITTGKEEIRKVALGTFVFTALFTLVVSFSGESAFDVVKKLPGVSEDSLKAHEDAAEYAEIGIEILGALAVFQLILVVFPSTGKLRNKLALVMILLAAFVFTVTARTAYLGGLIRHLEEFGTGQVPNPKAN